MVRTKGGRYAQRLTAALTAAWLHRAGWLHPRLHRKRVQLSKNRAVSFGKAWTQHHRKIEGRKTARLGQGLKKLWGGSEPAPLEMAKPDGIYGPLFDNAKTTNVEKLGDRPASGLTVSVERMLTALKGDNARYGERCAATTNPLGNSQRN